MTVYGFCQESDCIFVKDSPKIFLQNKVKREKAENIISEYRNKNSDNDSLTLIGVSKREVLEDLSYMIANPNSTFLNDSGYYCGVVVVLNWMLNNIPDKYAQAVIELTYYGETSFKHGSKKLVLPKAICKNVNYTWQCFEDETYRADLGKVSLSDFVLGVSLVFSEKAIQKLGLLWKNSTHRKANLGNFLFANTMPWEMDDYFRIIGIRNLTSSYYSPFENKDSILTKINSAVAAGDMPILMENHLLTADRHKNLLYKAFGAHYISIHGFTINYECNTISISYWDYGSVKNHREQSQKGSPLAARSLNAASRKAGRLTKIKRNKKYIDITIEQFFKGLKGYWIPIV